MQITLTSLVQYFGYNDKELLNHILKDNDIESSETYYYNIFFGRNGINGSFGLRENIFNVFTEMHPNEDISAVVLFYIADLLDKKDSMGNRNDDYIFKYEGNRESAVAFLLEKVLFQMIKKDETLISEPVEYILDSHSYLLKNFKDNKYYNNKLLKEYIEEMYKPNASEKDNSTFTIQDNDGYTNLRSGKGTSFEVIEKINSGSKITILDHNGDWWQVVTKSGKKGYVHKSKIREE